MEMDSEATEKKVGARWLSVLALLAAVTLGGTLGSQTIPGSGDEACNKKACDTDYGVCFSTDIRAHCTGEDPCSSKVCADTTG